MIDSWHADVMDIKQCFEIVAARHPACKIFLAGCCPHLTAVLILYRESIGATLALHAAISLTRPIPGQNMQLQGCLLLSPVLALNELQDRPKFCANCPV